MAVGIVCAGWMYGNSAITYAGALALALGIAIQNFPEGAIVSMPLLGEGVPKGKTFLYGVLSGIVEPIGAILVIVASGVLIPGILWHSLFGGILCSKDDSRVSAAGSQSIVYRCTGNDDTFDTRNVNVLFLDSDNFCERVYSSHGENAYSQGDDGTCFCYVQVLSNDC